MIGLLFWISVLLVVYVYAGYPLILAALAWLRPKHIEFAPATPGVTLLIAAYNEERDIAAKLDNSLALDYPRDCLQIVVAADGSDDRTVEIVCSYAGRGVELSFEPARSGKMHAINRAMPLVRHGIVLFSDANNLYRRDALREVTRPFSDPTVGAVCGRKSVSETGSRLGEADGLYWRYESFIKEAETRLGCCVAVSGEILAIRTELFAPPPAAVINDDLYIALDIIHKGYRVVYAPAAHSYEPVAADERQEAARRARINAGQFQIMSWSLRLLPFARPWIVWEVISHKLLRPVIPAAMLLAFITNLAALFQPAGTSASAWLTLAVPYNRIFFGLQLIFYAAALAASKIHLKGWLGRVLYLPLFLVHSNMAAAQGFYGYLTGRQTVIWKKAAR